MKIFVLQSYLSGYLFCSYQSQVKGQVNGQTILAMPVGVEKIVKCAKELEETGSCDIDLYLKGAIEGVVIKWATQINDVMIESPSNAFKNGQNPVPTIGTNFNIFKENELTTFAFSDRIKFLE